MRVIIDIETLPAPDGPDGCPIWKAMADQKFSTEGAEYGGAPRNWKDEDKIAAHRAAWEAGLEAKMAQERKAARDLTGLNGMVGRLACIGISVEVGPGIWDPHVLHPPIREPEVWGTMEAEDDLLTRLAAIDEGGPIQWVGWHIGFDGSFLRLRALRHRRRRVLEMFGDFDAKPWTAKTVDLQRLHPGRSMWSRSGTYGAKLGHAWMTTTGRLDPDASGGGSAVAALLAEGRCQTIVDHCLHDIGKTADMWNSMVHCLSPDITDR